MARIKVALVGATGTTGSSIADALLSSETQFEVTALSRPSSLTKLEYALLRDKGVTIVGADLRGPKEELIRILQGIDVVISAISFSQLSEEFFLAEASKAAGVKRFVQSALMVVIPPRGVVDFRQKKDDILAYIQKIRLPYTYIDAGYWYQLGLPRIPSGRFDYFLPSDYEKNEIGADGNNRMAYADVKDVGRYVARVIADPRTLNKKVHVYSETLTSNELYSLVERLSGENIPRNYVSGHEIESRIETVRQGLKADPQDTKSIYGLVQNQLFHSFAIRGDNTPENAEYLGYMDGKKLYPDFVYKTLESFVSEVLKGNARGVYR